MALSNFAKECQELFDATNLYSILGLSTENSDSLTEKEIKRAYYKSSLKYHPDRVQNDDSASEETKVEATKRFQLLGKVYSILSDGEKRKLYDESGVIDDEDNLESERDWSDYWRLLFKKVTVKDIENFKKKYKGTEEESNDLKALYLKCEGDLEKIYESAYCVDEEDDRERIRSILQQLIDREEVEHFAKFDRKETEIKKRRRLRKEQKEAAEAEKMLKEITGKKEMQDKDLFTAIAKRSSDRSSAFLKQLEEKYGGASASGGKKKKVGVKKRKVDDDDE